MLGFSTNVAKFGTEPVDGYYRKAKEFMGVHIYGKHMVRLAVISYTGKWCKSCSFTEIMYSVDETGKWYPVDRKTLEILMNEIGLSSNLVEKYGRTIVNGSVDEEHPLFKGFNLQDKRKEERIVGNLLVNRYGEHLAFSVFFKDKVNSFDDVRRVHQLVWTYNDGVREIENDDSQLGSCKLQIKALNRQIEANKTRIGVIDQTIRECCELIRRNTDHLNNLFGFSIPYN